MLSRILIIIDVVERRESCAIGGVQRLCDESSICQRSVRARREERGGEEEGERGAVVRGGEVRAEREREGRKEIAKEAKVLYLIEKEHKLKEDRW